MKVYLKFIKIKIQVKHKFIPLKMSVFSKKARDFSVFKEENIASLLNASDYSRLDFQNLRQAIADSFGKQQVMIKIKNPTQVHDGGVLGLRAIQEDGPLQKHPVVCLEKNLQARRWNRNSSMETFSGTTLEWFIDLKIAFQAVRSNFPKSETLHRSFSIPFPRPPEAACDVFPTTGREKARSFF